MRTDTSALSRSLSESTDIRRARQLILLSGLFLVLQVAATDDGASGSGAAVFWFIVGAVLLWFVYRRRSRVARGVVVVGSLLGAVIYALASIGDVHAAVLTVAFLGQALPLLSGPVRRHVNTSP